MALDELEYKFDTRWEWCSNTNEWSLFDSTTQQILKDAFENKLNTV